uniref:Uncharacterized protein n=1 Tax=Arundo donax TaxID=35708 RepID=A0A0A9DV85_ARUDO
MKFIRSRLSDETEKRQTWHVNLPIYICSLLVLFLYRDLLHVLCCEPDHDTVRGAAST